MVQGMPDLRLATSLIVKPMKEEGRWAGAASDPIQKIYNSPLDKNK
jgi:hypothetical protein